MAAVTPHNPPPSPLGVLTLVAALVLAGCPTAADGPEITVALAVSEVIPTVVTASWDIDLDDLDAAEVQFGSDTSYGLTAPVDVSGPGPFEALLVGNKGLSDVHARVVVQAGGETLTSDDVVITTGAVPNTLVNVSVDDLQPGLSHDGFVVTTTLVGPPAAVILDADGDYVWWHLPTGVTSLGRASLTRDGTALWMMDINMDLADGDTEDQDLIRVGLDGVEQQRLSIPHGHHDFLELPDGTLAYLAYDPRDIDEVPVQGDRLMEVVPGQDPVEIFNAWDHFEYEALLDPVGMIWPHANAVDYLPGEDAYLVSFLLFEAIAKIDRASGDLLWVLGGDDSDFLLPGGGTEIFEGQHQMQQLDDGSLLVFVNGDKPDAISRAVQVQLDEGAMEAELIWEYWPEPMLSSRILGDIHLLESGNRLITFSFSGQIHEVTEGGELVWQMAAGAGGTFGYTTYRDDLSPKLP